MFRKNGQASTISDDVVQGLSCLDMSAAMFAKSSSQRVDTQAECDPTVPIPLSAAASTATTAAVTSRDKTPSTCKDLQLAEKMPSCITSLPKVVLCLCDIM